MIIFSYLIRGLLLRLALALPAVTAIYTAFELGDRGRRLAQTIGWPAVLHATLLHLPLVAVQVLPAALMLAIALWLAALRQRGELEALAVLGGSAAVFGRPLIALGAACSLCALLVGELVVPPCERAAQQRTGVVSSAISGVLPGTRWLKAGTWFLHRRGDRLVALEITDGFAVQQRVEGRIGAAAGTLTDARAVRFAPPTIEQRRRLRLPTLNRATTLWHAPRPEAQGFFALRRRLASRSRAGQERPVERLLLHTKLAYPLLNLLFGAVGLAFALGRRRRAALAELGGAAAVLLSCWLTLAACFVAARAGWLSPLVGAWLPLSLGIGATAAVVARRASRA